MIMTTEMDKLDVEKATIDRVKIEHCKDAEDIHKLKNLLMKEVEQSKFLNELLMRRVQRMKEIVNIYELRIEFDENLCLK